MFRSRLAFPALVLAVALTAAAGADMPVAVAGTTVRDFTLKDVGGTAHRLSQYHDSTAVVLMFISTKCPVSNSYDDRMVDLAREYQPKGFQFLGINANANESVDEIVEHSLQHNFPFPVLKDVKNVVADRLGATRTPEIFVISPKMKVLYHGRIDDSMNPDHVESHDLKNALDEIIAGRPVKVAETKAFGCSIKRVK